MKKTVFILIAILISSCSPDEQIISTSSNKIGDVTKTPDLYIPELEAGWVYWDDGFGLGNPPYDNGTYGISYSPITFNSTIRDTVVTYTCPIANGASLDYSGQNDFVINKAEDGFVNGSGGYYYLGMISITTFKNGLPVGQVIKTSFDIEATDSKIGYNPDLQINYNAPFFPNAPFMFIPAQTADVYTNRAIARSGKILVVVEVNPDLEVHESNYNNNVSSLPLNVTIGTSANNLLGSAVKDESARLENKTHPPTNVIVTKKFTGKDKFVKLDWECPYHEPIYVKHWFTVKKNGVVVADKIDNSDYTEIIRGNYTTSTYQIIINVVGLGASSPTSVQVSR